MKEETNHAMRIKLWRSHNIKLREIAAQWGERGMGAVISRIVFGYLTDTDPAHLSREILRELRKSPRYRSETTTEQPS